MAKINNNIKSIKLLENSIFYKNKYNINKNIKKELKPKDWL